MCNIQIAEVLEEVQSILTDHLRLPLDVITPPAKLQEDLAIDSLDFAKISIALGADF